MNMHSCTDDFDLKLQDFQSVISLKEKEVPNDITQYYLAFQNLRQSMNMMDICVDDYGLSTVEKHEEQRAKLFEVYQSEIQNARSKNLSQNSQNIIKNTIEYVQQRVAHEVFKLNVKKDVIANTFRDLTKKSVSKRVTYGVHNKHNVDYSPFQVTEL
ncbi:MAG: hypothetical protein COY39_03355 [Alphaproteobacteria bacterium CG_4_10_14_0_8_um_filter_37_21]|nr:MAG: hypothetical protein COY39_03355 [Alphaproteobacteria bacterium CG_4_10_14_0_8_um_filter_37_21]